MQLSTLTSTNLKRYNSAVFAVKELIQVQKIDGYDHLIDTLMMAYYGIDDIVIEIEQLQRQKQIKRAQQFQNQNEG